MYTLYIANKNYSSWSLRPWVLLNYLDIPFEEILVPFQGATNTDEFLKFAPNGKVPCLHDGDNVIWDSLAICEYLADRHSGVWPEVKSAQARAWARCAAAEMHSGFNTLRNICGMTVGVRVKLYEKPAALIKDIKRVDQLWNEGLKKFGGPFLAGHTFTAVDAFFAPVVFRCRTYDLPLSANAKAYRDRILALDAMTQWEEAALAETWRDNDHENEILTYGEVTADYRSQSALVG
jgi:glutathione S-transferase